MSGPPSNPATFPPRRGGHHSCACRSAGSGGAGTCGHPAPTWDPRGMFRPRPSAVARSAPARVPPSVVRDGLIRHVRAHGEAPDPQEGAPAARGHGRPLAAWAQRLRGPGRFAPPPRASTSMPSLTTTSARKSGQAAQVADACRDKAYEAYAFHQSRRKTGGAGASRTGRESPRAGSPSRARRACIRAGSALG